MKLKSSLRGFTLIEVMVGVAVFLIFAIGVYSGLDAIFKIVYQSRMRILETALLSEKLEVARNIPYASVGILSGVPAGILPHTQTTTRNGANFQIITTVRNIDDPFDGMVTGTPVHDTSPADYKLVEMSAICLNCLQQTPVILSTIVAPKNLEGDTLNGALFVYVNDMNGQPVAGANVHVVNSSASPTIMMDDVTDNSGVLRIVDTPTGTLSYHLTVSKSGYSSDYTTSSSAQIPTPVHLPASVASQFVTEIYFSIDHVGSLTLHTASPNCSALGSRAFNLWGEKPISTGPDVPKYNRSLATDAGGNLVLSNMEWDHYHASASGTSYDLAGSIPMIPVFLAPGASQEFTLVLRPHTANSLLIKVKDAATGLPLSGATVHLTGTGFDESLVTELGYLRQTDWSGGGGQQFFIAEDKYFSDDGNLTVNNPAGDVKLKKSGCCYAGVGYLDSSIFDLGETGVTWRNIIWEPMAQPPQTGADPIVFQIATSNTSTPPSWSFQGPDGTSGSYYNSTTTLINASHNNKRYMRYRAFLQTADNRYTPQLSDLAFTFTSGCLPPGQSFFYGFSAGSYNLEVSRSGYNTNSGLLDIAGNMDAVVNLSPF